MKRLYLPKIISDCEVSWNSYDANRQSIPHMYRDNISDDYHHVILCENEEEAIDQVRRWIEAFPNQYPRYASSMQLKLLSRHIIAKEFRGTMEETKAKMYADEFMEYCRERLSPGQVLRVVMDHA